MIETVWVSVGTNESCSLTSDYTLGSDYNVLRTLYIQSNSNNSFVGYGSVFIPSLCMRKLGCSGTRNSIPRILSVRAQA